MITTETLSIDALRAVQQSGHLFAILDACDAPAVPILCSGLGAEQAVSLYRGDAEEEYADIAPYLIRVDSPDLLDWIVSYSATEAWGIFLFAPLSMEQARLHMRKFLKVLGPDGKRMYFRFYDPRVLEMFLPTCDALQLQEFFGPVKAYAVLEPIRGVVSFRLLEKSGRTFYA